MQPSLELSWWVTNLLSGVQAFLKTKIYWTSIQSNTIPISHLDFFFLITFFIQYHTQEPLKAEGLMALFYEDLKCSVWKYIGKIKVDHRLEEVLIVVFEEAFLWESLCQSHSSWEEAVQFSTYQVNMDGSALCTWHNGFWVALYQTKL